MASIYLAVTMRSPAQEAHEYPAIKLLVVDDLGLGNKSKMLAAAKRQARQLNHERIEITEFDGSDRKIQHVYELSDMRGWHLVT